MVFVCHECLVCLTGYKEGKKLFKQTFRKKKTRKEKSDHNEICRDAVALTFKMSDRN